MDENRELSLEEQQEALGEALDALSILLGVLTDAATDESVRADATPGETVTLDEATGELSGLSDEVGSLSDATASVDLSAPDAQVQLSAIADRLKDAWDGATSAGGKVKDTVGNIAGRGVDKLRDGADLAGDSARRIADQIEQASKSDAARRFLDAGGKILDLVRDANAFRACIELIIRIASGDVTVLGPEIVDRLVDGLRGLPKIGPLIPNPNP